MDSVSVVDTTSVVSEPPSSADLLTKKSGTKSWVHKFFAVYKTNNKLAKCAICHFDVKWGDVKWGVSTSSLISHIKHKHREVYDAALADQAKKLSAAADAAVKLPKQKTLSSLFPAATKDMKDRAHLKFIIECGLSSRGLLGF